MGVKTIEENNVTLVTANLFKKPFKFDSKEYKKTGRHLSAKGGVWCLGQTRAVKGVFDF